MSLVLKLNQWYQRKQYNDLPRKMDKNTLFSTFFTCINFIYIMMQVLTINTF